MKMIVLATTFAVAAGAQAAQPAGPFPVKPIRLIVDFPAGGVSDTLARAVAQPLSEVLGASIVVDNRPGANGMIAYEMMAKAPADGYTLGLISTAFAFNFSLQPKLPFARSDFAPLAIIATRPNALIAKAGLPAKTVKELIALARQKVGSSRVDLQACKLEYSIVSPK